MNSDPTKLTQEQEDWKTFQLKLVKCALVFAGLLELVSLPFLGFSPRFTSGLLLCTVIASLNFLFQAYTCKKVVESASGSGVGSALSSLSFVLRMLIYGVAFLFCAKVGGVCMIGAIGGFLTIPCSIYYSCLFKSHKMQRQETEGGI